MQKNKIFVSLDTRKSYVLEKSLPLKIDLLNDVSGLEYDYKIIKILKKVKFHLFCIICREHLKLCKKIQI